MERTVTRSLTGACQQIQEIIKSTTNGVVTMMTRFNSIQLNSKYGTQNVLFQHKGRGIGDGGTHGDLFPLKAPKFF